MLTGFKVVRNKGFTNLTGVHPYISKIAVDTKAIENIFNAYNFPDREIENRTVHVGANLIEIPYKKTIYGVDIEIANIRDILYLSDIADIYDNPNNVIKRRIYHSNIQPLYHGFVNGFGNLMSMLNYSDKNIETYMVMLAYSNHYFQDAFAPMHISLKDQDIHIEFEHAFDNFLNTNAQSLEDKVIDMVNKRSVIDLSKYRGITDFAMKFVRNYMDVRDKMISDYRDGDRSFTGIEYFLYGAVLATIGNTANFVSKDYIWRRYL